MNERNELKKIRATKYKNKQHYKDKSKIISKPENKDQIEDKDKTIIDDVSTDSILFKRRGVESNWYRYEPKEEDTLAHAKDFSLIASAPISQGSYFQFKSDKIISDEVEGEQLVSKLFNLDLDTLSKSFATIPFYERCDIDEKYLTELQVNEMKRKANENMKFYEKHLEKLQQEQQKDLRNETELCAIEKLCINEAQGNNVLIMPREYKRKQGTRRYTDYPQETIEISLQEVLEGSNLQKETDENLKATEESDELEQWLDDILDD